MVRPGPVSADSEWPGPTLVLHSDRGRPTLLMTLLFTITLLHSVACYLNDGQRKFYFLSKDKFSNNQSDYKACTHDCFHAMLHYSQSSTLLSSIYHDSWNISDYFFIMQMPAIVISLWLG